MTETTTDALPEDLAPTARRAAALAGRWARWYTGRVDDETGALRLSEIESDLWEQLSDGRDSGASTGAVARSIYWRVVAGVPADLSWVRQQRAIVGGATMREESPTSALLRTVGRSWWIALALGIAGWYLVMAMSNLTGDGIAYLQGTLLALILASSIVVGAVLRTRLPFAGRLLMVAGAGPAVLLWWAPVVVALAALVIVGAAVDLIILPVARRRMRPATALGRIAVIAAALIATVAPLVLSVLPGVLVSGVVVVALVFVALLRRHRTGAASPVTKA